MNEGRRLSAPRVDGGVLIDPTWSAISQLIDRNREAASATHDSVSISGESLRWLAEEARSRLLREAFDYTSQYRSASRPTSDGVLLAGHQPELFHVGVWMKNFALAKLARETGSAAHRTNRPAHGSTGS